jgi:hypothetical protein
MAWFYTREALPRVWLIAEPQHVCTWMVAGGEHAVILDTGMGILPIRPVAESLTQLPVSVVNTHYHFDHVGGNHEFDEIAIHEIGAPLIEQAVPRDLLDAYLGYADRQLRALPEYRELDREFFWLLGAESEPRPFPESFDPSAWTIEPSRATQTLREGDRVDLHAGPQSRRHLPARGARGASLRGGHDQSRPDLRAVSGLGRRSPRRLDTPAGGPAARRAVDHGASLRPRDRGDRPTSGDRRRPCAHPGGRRRARPRPRHPRDAGARGAVRPLLGRPTGSRCAAAEPDVPDLGAGYNPARAGHARPLHTTAAACSIQAA